MTLALSKRASFIHQSEIRNMSIECERVGGINLSQGVCDTPLPPLVERAVTAAVAEGYNSYTRYDGLVELRQALARRLKSYNGLEVDPDRHVIISAGSTGAFYCACLALLNPGDGVILFEPYYGYHLNTLQSADLEPQFVPLHAPDWSCDIAALERAITPRTRGIMINTPCNPCGKVWTRAELEAIGEIARKHDLFVFTDEVYEYLLYDGRQHISPASIPALADRTITIGSYSKTFSITGWRIGYAVADERWSRMIGYMNDLVYVCAPAPLQLAVARGIDSVGADYYENLKREYTLKRDMLCASLESAGLTPIVPQGAYYVLADVGRVAGTTSKDRAMELLRRTGVATVPGSAFYQGHAGDRFVRFCFAKTEVELQNACERLSKL